MDDEMRQLAGAAADTMVRLAVTDAWQRMCRAVTALWQRFFPERVESVMARLAETRSDLVAIRESGDAQAETDLIDEWAGHLRRLLAADQKFHEGLSSFIAELQDALPSTREPETTVKVHATAHGHGRIYVAGQDFYLTEGWIPPDEPRHPSEP
jgi:hypothetical protein